MVQKVGGGIGTEALGDGTPNYISGVDQSLFLWSTATWCLKSSQIVHFSGTLPFQFGAGFVHTEVGLDHNGLLEVGIFYYL